MADNNSEESKKANEGQVEDSGVDAVAPWQQQQEEEQLERVEGVVGDSENATGVEMNAEHAGGVAIHDSSSEVKPQQEIQETTIEQEQQQDEGAEKEVEKPEEKQLESGMVQHEETGQDGEVSIDMDALAALGSVDEIAAAAMQAADLTAFFGNAIEEDKEIDRGTKRSHDEMTEAQREAEVMAQFSTVAPTPAEIALSEKTAIPAPASFQNSFSEFQRPSTTAIEEAIPVVAQAPMLASVAEPVTSTDVPIVTSTTEEGGEGAEGEDMTDMPLIGFHDLEAVAQAAMGLDIHGNPLPGNEESHRALAEAVKRLSAAQGISSSDSQDDENDKNGEGGPVKRFQCTKCERAFARAYNLNTHLATHDPDPARSKPFPCPYPSCKTDGGRSFSRKHDLQRHVASTHENEPEPGINGVGDENGLASLGLGTPGRKFRCEDCGRAFVRRDALKRHQCTKIMESSSTPVRRTEAPDYYSNAAAGLSLYTSNTATASSAQQQRPAHQSYQGANDGASVAGSSYDSDPFGPNGITYENLSKEVQDMAMQLVAQAQSYNEQKTQPSGEGVVEAVAGKQAVAQSVQPSQTAPLPEQPPQAAPLPQQPSQPAPLPLNEKVAPVEVKREEAAQEKTSPSANIVGVPSDQAAATTTPAIAVASAPAPALPSATVKVEEEATPSTTTFPTSNTPTPTSAPAPNLVSAQ